MTLNIPQLFLIGWSVLAVCVNIYKDGQPKTSKENFYIHSACWLFEVCILGTTEFFSSFGFAQSIWGLLSVIGLISAAKNHGQIPTGAFYRGLQSVASFFIVMTIYYFGGFFN